MSFRKCPGDRIQPYQPILTRSLILRFCVFYELCRRVCATIIFQAYERTLVFANETLLGLDPTIVLMIESAYVCDIPICLNA